MRYRYSTVHHISGGRGDEREGKGRGRGKGQHPCEGDARSNERERERRSSCRSFTTRTRTCARGIRRLNIICGPYRSLPPRERRRTSRWKRGPLFAVFFASTFYCHSDVWTRRRPLSAVLLVERGEDFLRIVLGNGRRDWAFFEVFLLLKIRRKIRRLSE